MNSDSTLEQAEFAIARRTRSRRFAYRAGRIIAVAHLYVAWSLLRDLPLAPAYLVLGGLGFAASALLIPFGTMARVFFDEQKLIDRLTWAGGITLGWFSTLLILTLLRDLALLATGSAAGRAESVWAVLALSVLVTMLGFFNARRTAKVVPVTIPLENLPPGLEGFTIAQISDVHIGPTIRRRYVQRIVERVNALGADAIALTGDIADGPLARLAPEAAPLGQLRARHGAYVVTGNHEYHYGADDWIDAFAGLGLIPLCNSHRVIEHNGAAIVLAGVHDYSANQSAHAHASDPEAAVAGSPAAAPRIILAHQPRSADAAAAAGCDLQLSGHTHGGQFWPWNYFVRLQQPYTAGLHRHGQLWVYTSRGTGYWGPPKRFGAPSEITLLTLTRAP